MLTDATSPEVRRSGIGGSDSAAICGESPWATPLDVYLSKRGLVEKEQAEAAEWGQILEPTVLRQYALRQGVFVVGRGEEGDVHGWDGEGTSEMEFLAEFKRFLMTTSSLPLPRLCRRGIVLYTLEELDDLVDAIESSDFISRVSVLVPGCCYHEVGVFEFECQNLVMNKRPAWIRVKLDQEVLLVGRQILA